MTRALTRRDDAELVMSAKAGDQAAFAELYSRYFSGVYDFVYRMTRSRDDAADVTQDAFLQAMQRLGQIENAASFKAWLFSIARHLSLRRIERSGRMTPASHIGNAEADDDYDPLLRAVDPDATANPERAAETADLAALVWQAAASLDPRQYALLDLHVRQGLNSGEIAAVLGVSKGNASTMLNRMRTSVGEAIGSFVLARTGSRDCDVLRQVVGDAEIPPVTADLRRSIARHTRRCQRCTATRRRMLAPAQLLGGLAPVPAAAGQQERIWEQLAQRWGEAPASLEPHGVAEAPSDTSAAREAQAAWWTNGRRRVAVTGIAGIAGVLAVFLVALSMYAPGETGSLLAGPPASETPVSTDTPSSLAAAPPRAATALTSATPQSQPGAQDATADATDSPPTLTPTPDTTPPLIDDVTSSVDTLGTNSSDPCEVDTATITARVIDPGGIASVDLVYTAPDIAAVVAMAEEGSGAYSALVGPLSVPPGELTYHVEATDRAGNVAASPPQTIALVACVN